MGFVAVFFSLSLTLGTFGGLGALGILGDLQIFFLDVSLLGDGMLSGETGSSGFE